MRLKLSFVIIALAAATPAAGQNETVDPAANSQVNAVDSNALAPAPTDPAAAPALEAAPLPYDANVETVETDVELENGADRDFPWGLIGLVGLVGLLGRRRSS